MPRPGLPHRLAARSAPPRWVALGLLCGCLCVGVCGGACGGVYEAVAPDAPDTVQAALWPDTLRQGDGPLVAVLLLDLPPTASWQLTTLAVDEGVEVFSLRPLDDPDCQAAVAAGFEVPLRFSQADPQRLCVRLQPSPVATPGPKRLRLTLTVDDAPRVADATAYILQALRP